MNQPRPDLIAVKDLCYEYGERRAVDSVSFEVLEGECFGLLGPNGAGKSTTISCVAGLLSKWTGEMTLAGRPFHPSTATTDRAKLGLVPQELAIYPELTAQENLRFFAKLSGVSSRDCERRVEENLEVAGLLERRHDLVKTFSGGMKRRLNLAIGLLHKPEVLLLDEPTVGVDPQSRNHIFETLVRLKTQGLSILYTTHYMEEAERLCDRIAIMNESKILATGSADQLIKGGGGEVKNLEDVFLKLTGRSLRDQ